MDNRDNSDSAPAEPPATAAAATPRSVTPVPPSKILSRNGNGTVVMTSSPGNEAELQLYRVMQRASLLAYYDTLLEMGGDDVQQLCDAGEEEFLEIMALVGMASKPLHVRRLQKALQEWVTNPGLFQTPLLPSMPSSPVAPVPPTTPTPAPLVTTPRREPVSTPPYVPVQPPTVNHSLPKEVPVRQRSPPPLLQFDSSCTSNNPPLLGPCTSPGPSPGSPLQLTPILLESQISRLAESAEALVKSLPQFEPKPHNTKKKNRRDLENVMTMTEDDPRRMEEIRKYAAIYGRFDCKRKPEKPLTLHEVSVNEAAAQICKLAPALLTRRDELFPLARQVVRDSGYHYSKTHSNFIPMYRSHTQQSNMKNGNDTHGCKRQRLDALSPPPCDSSDNERCHRQERLEAIAEELRTLGDRTEELVVAAQQVRENNDLSAIHSLQQQMELVQTKQTQLLLEQSDLLKQPLPMRFYRRSSGHRSGASYSETEKVDTDDTDSQLSFSNASSPSQEVGDSRESLADSLGNNNVIGKSSEKGKQFASDSDIEETVRNTKSQTLNHNDDAFGCYYHDSKVQVIATSGGNIIAVANPALSMSPAIMPSTEPLPCLRSESPLSLKIERQSPKLVNPD